MSDKVYIVMSADMATKKLRLYIDEGRLADANSLSYDLKSFYDSVKSFLQSRGANINTHLYERSIAECTLSVAEDFPQIAEQFGKKFGTWIAIGMGFSLHDASSACKLSAQTGEIELYGTSSEMMGDPDDDSVQMKELPPNLYDPENPPAPEAKDKPKDKANPPGMMSLDADMKGQQELMQQFMPQPSAPPQQPQQQGQQTDQNGQPTGPRDLREALNGGQVQGYQPEMPQGQEQTSAAPQEQEVEQAVDSAEKEAEKFDDKLADKLQMVRQQLPQLMGLAQDNPKAFKQSMDVIKQLIALARSHQKLGKTEADEIVEQLEKASLSFAPKFPVGTLKDGKKKVLVNGKAYWRSVRSGQLKDQTGSAISVRSSNLQAANENPEPKEK